ncbi:MAG: uroporphyrinogen-III synthase [Acidimicrobiales bacterium]
MSGGADGRPLAGRRVVVCRAEGDAGSLADALRDRGAEPVLVPLVVRAAPADGGAALRAAAARLDRYAWVAVTSAAGAGALLAALTPGSPTGAPPGPAHGHDDAGDAPGPPGTAEPAAPHPARRAGADAPWPPGVRVAAVGPATAEALRRAGVEPDLVPPTATAADLAAAFPPAPAPAAGGSAARVLAPLAELAGDDLVEGLRAKGWTVDRIDAYRLAEPPPLPAGAALPDGLVGADAVAFTSPSVVDRFCDRFGPALVPPLVACIGPRTAARAGQRGLAGLVTAEDHTAPGLVAALVAALG